MRRFGLLGACLALFVGVALTVISPAGAEAPAPTIKCDGDTVVHWDNAYLKQHGKGAVTDVTIVWTVIFGLKTSGGAAIDGNGNNARAGTALFATRAVARLTFTNGTPFVTSAVAC